LKWLAPNNEIETTGSAFTTDARLASDAAAKDDALTSTAGIEINRKKGTSDIYEHRAFLKTWQSLFKFLEQLFQERMAPQSAHGPQ